MGTELCFNSTISVVDFSLIPQLQVLRMFAPVQRFKNISAVRLSNIITDQEYFSSWSHLIEAQQDACIQVRIRTTIDNFEAFTQILNENPAFTYLACFTFPPTN